MYFISVGWNEFFEAGPILPCYPRYQCFLHRKLEIVGHLEGISKWKPAIGLSVCGLECREGILMDMRQLAKTLGYFAIRLSEYGKAPNVLDLTGDRNVEWSWVAARMPEKPGEVLDFRSSDAPLGLIAAIMGEAVAAVDLQQIHLPYAATNRGGE
jgi:hypothetical protein